MKRRDFLSLSVLSTAALGMNFYSSPLFGMSGTSNKKLVFIFLKGGADVLSMFPSAAKDATRTINNPIKHAGYLLHPSLKDLAGINPSHMAILHHVGVKKRRSIRSHFEQIDLIERGYLKNGFLARALNNKKLKGITIGANSPLSVMGADVPLISSLKDLKSGFNLGKKETRTQRLELMKDDTDSALDRTIEAAQNNYDALEEGYANNVKEEGNGFVQACETASFLTKDPAKGDFNPSIITIDFGGWDDHASLNANDPKSGFSTRANTLASGIKKLYEGMSNDTYVVVMTEFGRTLYVNGNDGTDHGEGGAMLVLGAGAKNLFSGSQYLKAWDFKKIVGAEKSSHAFQVVTEWSDVMKVIMSSQFGISDDIFV
jgi:uncharacterized protein (DUF1501 family)